MQDKSSIQQKVQALCDCFAESDPLAEMASVSQETDKDDASLKWLALAILHGIDRNAEEIRLYSAADGGVKAIIRYRERELPLSEHMVGQDAMKALRQMIHIDGDKAKVPLALGIRDSSIEILVKVKQEDDGEEITLKFPK